MAGVPGARPIRLPRALTPLRHRNFRLLVIGQVTSNVGDACYAVALPWYVLATHGGAVLLGTVLAAYGIPRTALIAFGGYASDRWRPQTVMLLTDVVRALVVGALALTAALGPARAEVLVPLAIVIGAGEGLFLPASFSIVPSLLSGDDLGPGNALSSSGTQLRAPRAASITPATPAPLAKHTAPAESAQHAGPPGPTRPADATNPAPTLGSRPTSARAGWTGLTCPRSRTARSTPARPGTVSSSPPSAAAPCSARSW